MSKDVSYPSDEVARHASIEVIRHSPCVIVIGAGWEGDDGPDVRVIRCGQPPDDDAGRLIRIIAWAIGELSGETS